MFVFIGMESPRRGTYEWRSKAPPLRSYYPYTQSWSAQRAVFPALFQRSCIVKAKACSGKGFISLFPFTTPYTDLFHRQNLHDGHLSK